MEVHTPAATGKLILLLLYNNLMHDMVLLVKHDVMLLVIEAPNLFTMNNAHMAA